MCRRPSKTAPDAPRACAGASLQGMKGMAWAIPFMLLMLRTDQASGWPDAFASDFS